MERPILFSTPMVQAILDGRKTQTRRVIKDKDITNWFDIDVDGKPIAYIDQETGDSYPPTHRAKYQPGDVLWVRETFCEVPYEHNHVPIKGGHITIPKYAYKADSERDYTGIWKPSIHMPREAARIFLRVTNVKVERLQDITEEDAKAEGVKPIVDAYLNILPNGYRLAFNDLWNDINLKRGYGWDTNPWVWVIEFKKISKDLSAANQDG